jgi:hypothetical protein
MVCIRATRLTLSNSECYQRRALTLSIAHDSWLKGKYFPAMAKLHDFSAVETEFSNSIWVNVRLQRFKCATSSHGAKRMLWDWIRSHSQVDPWLVPPSFNLDAKMLSSLSEDKDYKKLLKMWNDSSRAGGWREEAILWRCYNGTILADVGRGAGRIYWLLYRGFSKHCRIKQDVSGSVRVFSKFRKGWYNLDKVLWTLTTVNIQNVQKQERILTWRLKVGLVQY